jgi:hypothetical protein
MQFFSTILLAASALASLVAAGPNAVHFVNQGSEKRTIYFTAQEGLPTIKKLSIEGHKTANQTFPTGWIGNFYSVSKGAANVPGMLGELRFDGYASSTYFDVSAIVNPTDTDGVKQIFPKNSPTPIAGCETFPCSNTYYSWDDVATQATDENELICLVGNPSNERKRGLVARMSREFVTS